MEVLAGHWGQAKSKQDLVDLQAAAVADGHTGNGLQQMIKRPAESLFPPRNHYEVDTHFVVCMREQYVHSVLQYTLDIEAAISAASAMGIVNHLRGAEQCVGGYDAFRAIKAMSPHKSDDQVEHYIRIGGGADGADLDVFDEKFSTQVFITNLKKVELKPFHKA